MKNSIITLCSAAAILSAVLISAAACSAEGGSGANDGGGGGTSQGGSMARFTISGDGNYLFTVDEQNLTTVSIKTPDNPLEVNVLKNIGWNIETIFSKDNLLFIGSQEAMYIYNIEDPEFPTRVSSTSHFKSCDPVVAYGNLAFVTLNSSMGTWCGNRGDVLQIYDISDLRSPQRLSENQINSPRGLAVDGEKKIVFVCYENGVEAWDFTDPANPRGKARSTGIPQLEKIDAYDCIALPGVTAERDGTLLIVGADGLYQIAYKRTDDDKVELAYLSKIDLRKE